MRRGARRAHSRIKKFQPGDVDYNRLCESILIPQNLTVWDPPAEAIANPVPPVFIPLPEKEDVCLLENLDVSKEKESNSLQRYTKLKHEQLATEKRMMNGCGKTRDILLLRRYQLLPKIPPDGKEKNVITLQSYEEPKVFPDWLLWAPIIFDIKEKNGITRQMTKRERGFTAVPEWVGCPKVSDEIRDELGLNSQHVLSYLKQHDDEEVCRQQNGCFCVPAFDRLAVRGFNYKQLHDTLQEPVKEMFDVETKSQDRSLVSSRDNIVIHENRWKKLRHSLKITKVCLSLGHLQFYWSTDPQKSNQTWIVELGSTADINDYSIEWVLMRNTGTVTIKYQWVRINKDERDAVKKRMEKMKLIFDSCDGTILPGDVIRIPFQYKATSYGQFSEDWRLLTQPVLENGALIILRLWGFTRSDDINLRRRELLEANLEERMKFSIVRAQIKKLIDYLPLEDDILDNAKFQSPLKGNDLFTHNNPGLYYKSSSVYRLGKIFDIIFKENRKTDEEILYTVDEENNEEMAEAVGLLKSSAGSIDDSVSKRPKKQFGGSQSSTSNTNSLVVTVSEMVLILLKEIYNEGNISDQSLHPQKYDVEMEDKRKSRVLVISDDIGLISQKASFVEKEELYNVEEDDKKVDDSIRPTPNVRPHRLSHVNAGIVVNQIRHDLLTCNTDLIKQEALYILMSEEIENLTFKPFLPYPNWKIPFFNGLLSNAMDEFSDYAHCLELRLYEAEDVDQERKQRDIEETAVADEGEEIGSQSEAETFDRQSGAKSEIEKTKHGSSNSENLRTSIIEDVVESVHSDHEEEEQGQTASSNPRTYFDPKRYAQYYRSLYCRMYSILCDLMDTMDGCAFTKAVIDEQYGKENFIKVRKISFDVTTESQLNRPLPPRWVKLYQRMEEVKTNLRERKADNTENPVDKPPL